MITENITVNGIDFIHLTPESEYGKIRCIETGDVYESVYSRVDVGHTFEEIIDDSEISDTEALNIITGGV